MKVYFVNKNQLTLDQIKQKYDIKVNGDSPYASNCNYETTLNGSLMCVKLKGLHLSTTLVPDPIKFLC